MSSRVTLQGHKGLGSDDEESKDNGLSNAAGVIGGIIIKMKIKRQMKKLARKHSSITKRF